jgi:hypothetical protein
MHLLNRAVASLGGQRLSDEPSPFVDIEFTEPSSRIFNRSDWQDSSFMTLARLIISYLATVPPIQKLAASRS